MKRLVFLFAASFALSAAAQPADVFTSEEQGFRLRRPDPPWTVTETAPAAGTTYTLKIVRTDGGGERGVTIYVADLNGFATADEACDRVERARKTDAEFSGLKRGKGEVAGGEAPWLEFQYARGGPKYSIRYYYVVHHDVLFILMCGAPAESFAAAQEEFAQILAGFEFIPIADPEARKSKAMLRKAADSCGSEIRWERSWKAAAARAKKENQLVVVLVERDRGLSIERYAPSTLFMDSDIVALMHERFVAFQWNSPCGAPFEDAETYGLGPFTTGQGVLFATPEGKIVREAAAFDPFVFDTIARGVLRDYPGAPPFDMDDVEDLLCRGDLDAAGKLLQSPSSAEDFRLKASLLRRLRNGPEALKALGEARKKGAKNLDIEEAVICLRMGEYGAAESVLEGREEPEAIFWHVVACSMRYGLEHVRKEIVEFVEKNPDNRWAWRAAAMLCGKGMWCCIDHAAWSEEARVMGCDSSPSKPAGDVKKAKQDAVAFLLRTQLADGSWPSPDALTAPLGPYAVAIASIDGAALLPSRADPGAIPAIDRALAFVLKYPLVFRPDQLLDYTIWGQIFSLRFLAECVTSGFGDRAVLLPAMSAIVSEMRKARLADGGWAYYREEGRPGASIGFVTAAAYEALREAATAGVDVPKSLLNHASDLVASMRQSHDAFAYFAANAADTAGREAETALRSPLHALVLKQAGKGGVAGIRASLELYLKHREHDRRERGKSLYHTSPEGLASYYLLFGYAYAAEALGELPAEERGKYRAALVEDVLEMRTEDGGFCDNPGFGRPYGAGMALRALEKLGEGK